MLNKIYPPKIVCQSLLPNDCVDTQANTPQKPIFLETLAAEHHSRFIQERFEPYLKSIYNDLAMRSQQSRLKKAGSPNTIDKNTFC